MGALNQGKNSQGGACPLTPSPSPTPGRGTEVFEFPEEESIATGFCHARLGTRVRPVLSDGFVTPDTLSMLLR